MRKNKTLKFFDRSGKLNLKNREYYNFVKDFLNLQLKDDVKKGDITTDILKISKRAKARVLAKDDGIIAGLQELGLLYAGCVLRFRKKDGDKIKKGNIIVEIQGNLKELLILERTGLNIIQRMSGIATATYELNKKIKNKVLVGATRKTQLGPLDKRAVALGNGLTHRLDLSDAILIKDNHIKALGNDIGKIIEMTEKNKKTEHIEVEVENEKQALTAAKKIRSLKTKKHFALMLDNIKPDRIKSIIKKLKKENLHGLVLLEASGGITFENIQEYAASGVDFISLGCSTHSVKSLNISQEIV